MQKVGEFEKHLESQRAGHGACFSRLQREEVATRTHPDFSLRQNGWMGEPFIAIGT